MTDKRQKTGFDKFLDQQTADPAFQTEYQAAQREISAAAVNMVVGFTGHRNNNLGGFKVPNPTYNHVVSEIEKTLNELKPTAAISGMAIGLDQWAAKICVRLGIPFTAAIPFIGQENVWPADSQAEYRTLLLAAKEKVIVSDGGYSAKKLQIRNEWIVNHCDKLIAVWNGVPSGGTYNCIQYAKQVGKEIIYIKLF